MIELASATVETGTETVLLLVYLILPTIAALAGLYLGRAIPVRPTIRAIAGALGVVLGVLIEVWLLGTLTEAPVPASCRVPPGNVLTAVFWIAFYISAVSSGFAISAVPGTRVGLTVLTLAAAVLLYLVFAFASILNDEALCPWRP